MHGRSIKLIRLFSLLLFLGVIAAVIWNYSHRSWFFRTPARQEARPLPPNASELVEGIHIYQSENGRTTVELDARVRLGFKDNKSLFETVSARFLGKTGDRRDTITSDRCEVDDVKEEIVFWGNVVITLSGMPQTSQQTAPSDKEITTIKTPKIIYRKKDGKAETGDAVEFYRGRIHGNCRGLSYDSNRELLQLLADVKIRVDSSRPGMAPASILAGGLNFFNPVHRVELLSPVKISQVSQELTADHLWVYLDDDQAAQRIEATGKVRTVSYDPGSLMEIAAPNMFFYFRAGGRLLERISAWNKVSARSLDPAYKRDLNCEVMELAMQPESNKARLIRAAGEVVALLGNRPKGKAALPVKPDSAPEGGDYLIKTPELWITFRPDGLQLSIVEGRRAVYLEELPLQAKQERKILEAREAALFFAEQNRAERMTADHEVKVQLLGAQDKTRTTWSDHLVATMDPQTQQISQLHQSGHFRYSGDQWEASSEEARYFAAERRIHLDGHPMAQDPKSKTTANSMEFYEAANLFKATGHVRTVMADQQPQEKMALFRSSDPVYGSADFLEVNTQSGIAHYWQQAKLWQGEQLLRAESILVFQKEKKLEAEDKVSTLFYLEEAPKSATNQPKQPSPTLIQAEKMIYRDQTQKAVYEKNVRMRHSMGLVQSDRLEVELETIENQTRPRRLIALGHVKIFQPQRLATSEMAEYFRADDRLVLSGGSPRVLDSERGSTSGARLTLFRNNDSIFVEGDSETRSYAQPRRVSP